MGQMVFQIAAINKPLVSVSKLVEAGYIVVFDENGSYIKHKTSGDLIKMRKERGVFVVDAYTAKPKKPEGAAAKKSDKSLFTRRG